MKNEFYRADYLTDTYRDQYGKYHIVASMEDNGNLIEWLFYDVANKRLKELGGLHSLRCTEKQIQRWYRNDHLVEKALNKFCEDCNK